MRTKQATREDGTVRASYTYDNPWSSDSPQSRGQFICASLLEFRALMAAFNSYLIEEEPRFFSGENGTLVFSPRIIEVSRV
jgi:hypothetical protein